MRARADRDGDGAVGPDFDDAGRPDFDDAGRPGFDGAGRPDFDDAGRPGFDDAERGVGARFTARLVGFACAPVNVQESVQRMGESTIAELGVPEPHRTASRPERAAPGWLERACILVPALDAERTIGGVVAELGRAIPELAHAIVVVDDGSRDATARIAEEHGAIVVASHPSGANRGKGAALRAGLDAARARGMTVALSVDADGQHPADEARRVLFAATAESALVLGVRDLARDGAPRANRFSNGISNHFLSSFARRPLADTQCGLRRYPVEETLALRTSGQGYDFEAEVLLRAVWSGLDVVEEPVRVLYPDERTTHFRIGRDVGRIIRTVVATVGEHWLRASAARGEGA